MTHTRDQVMMTNTIVLCVCVKIKQIEKINKKKKGKIIFFIYFSCELKLVFSVMTF